MKNKVDKKDHLNKYIGISAIAHIVILIFSYGLPSCTSNEIIIPPSIQVDIVPPPTNLPTKQEPAPTPEPEPEPEPEEKLPEKKLPEKEPEVEEEKVNLEEEKKKKNLE